ncbi:UNVERIFIED_CONTAM: hypothetical protein GTU68_036464 [Idotea baltica]|nr:hypothetical protein [Idotea baltica]
MIVLKFGGSSVGKPERIRNILSIVQPRIQAGEDLCIVCSAFGGTTDQLISMIDTAARGDEKYLDIINDSKQRHYNSAEELMDGESKVNLLAQIDILFLKLENILRGVFLLKEASDRSYDYVMSFGERLSNLSISHFFTSQGVGSVFIDAREIIKTNSEFRSARVYIDETYKNIIEHVSKHAGKAKLITGFIASDQHGRTTTLGRGGSDYTAALFAAALNAEALEIWTDVDGVLTTNPKLVNTAYPIHEMSYVEAMEMSHFGAKVIYPPTIIPVHEKGIPTYIKNTFNPSSIGTIISNQTNKSNGAIKGLSSTDGLVLLTLSGSGMQGVPGVASRMFNSLATSNINVILITQASSEHSICVAIKEERAQIAREVLKAEFQKEIENKDIAEVHIEESICIIAAVGEAMKNQPGIAGKLFSTLGRNGVNIEAIAQGSSELNISFAVKSRDEEKALNLIHDTFFHNTIKTLNLFIVGTGLIGGTLIKQLKEFKASILESKGIDLKLIGISNSRKMLLTPEGIDIKHWEASLKESDEEANPQVFVDKMIELNLANSIFVDNTASKSIPDFYKKILNNSISISTPNKVASSAKYEYYNELIELAKKRNTKFLIETNVGAGLPIISTIKSLRNSGDKIKKIQAVLSGSLSYIFNNFSSSSSFHDIVKEAQKLGYTEPDPRDDLSGSDVKRKITILARESGYGIDQSEVELKAILPQDCMDQQSVDLFFQSLITHNDHFVKMIQEAESKNERLRYIASFENGKANIELMSVDASSPFYNLANSDNMISFNTERYSDSPLVISGPGAGANVTAAGVFSEIMQIATESFDY